MRRAALTFVVWAVAACSGAPAATQPLVTVAPVTPTPAASATLAPPPTEAPWPQEQLGAAYLACLDPYNAVVRATNSTISKTTSVKTAAAAFGDLADAIGALDKCIRAIPWTEEYEEDVKAKLKADSAMQITANEMSKATKWTVLNSYAKDMDAGALAAAAASNLLRGDLGLPPPK